MKIIIDHKIPYIKGALEPLAEVKYIPGNKISPVDVEDADALIIRTRTKCNKALLEGSSVKFIATATIGYDHIDTAWLEQQGIAWTNAPGCNSSSVEQYIVSTLLYLANMDGFELSSKTLGIIGVGNVGKKVAHVAEVLGCKVLLNDPPRARQEGEDAFVGLEELLKQSDIITMHLPLIRKGEDKTFHLAAEDFFNQMKEESVLINTSRGEVVDEAALLQAMSLGRIKDAVLDVFENEPKINRELVSKLTLATPHIAGYSADGKANGTMMSVQAVSRFFGLGMDAWQPKNIAMPGSKEILVDGGEAEELDLLTEVYARTYSVQEDHDRLVDNMDRFEKLRGDYRIRREAKAYAVRVFNDDGKYRSLLEGLGFSVIGDSCY